MPSELWQRLREARKFADKTQLDMARAAGVTRSGYAFWETADEGSRTRPNSDQIVALCKLTKVPVEWLLDDKANVSDIWRTGGAIAKTPAEPPAYNASDRAQQRFWAAVEYVTTMRGPSRDGSFGRPVRAGALELTADYCHAGTLAVFSRDASDSAVLQTAGYMLILAKLSRVREPRLLLLLRSEQEPNQAMTDSVRRFVGVDVQYVDTPEQAATLLLQ